MGAWTWWGPENEAHTEETDSLKHNLNTGTQPCLKLGIPLDTQ